MEKRYRRGSTQGLAVIIRGPNTGFLFELVDSCSLK